MFKELDEGTGDGATEYQDESDQGFHPRPSLWIFPRRGEPIRRTLKGEIAFLVSHCLEQRQLCFPRGFVLGTQGNVLFEVILENGNLLIHQVNTGFESPAFDV